MGRPKRRPSRMKGDTSVAEAFGQLRSDFDMAKDSRFQRRRTGVSFSGTGADYHVRNDSHLMHMIEVARDIDRNDMVLGQGIDRAVDNIVRDGVKIVPETGSPELDAELTVRFSQYCSDPELCDAAGENDIVGQQKMAVRHCMVDGELSMIPLENGTMQSIEAHRIRTPSGTNLSVVNGFLLDTTRRRLEAWVTKEDVSPSRTVRLVREVEKYKIRDENGHRQFFQIYNPKRVSQTRGITALAPIGDIVTFNDDIHFAMLLRQQVAACFAVIEEVEAGSVEGGYGGASPTPTTGEQSEDTLADGTVRKIEGIAPGMHLKSQPGHKIRLDSPNIPGPQFIPHALLIMQIMSINIGLPLQVFLLDPTMTNFSGWRGAIEQARLGFQHWRMRVLGQRMMSPLYRYKVRQWLAEDIDAGRQTLLRKLFAERGDASKPDPLRHRV